jgi:hypothetical protein
VKNRGSAKAQPKIAVLLPKLLSELEIPCDEGVSGSLLVKRQKGDV